MKEIRITREQARRFLLSHQGLWPPRALRGKESARGMIAGLGCIQFDPLNIVGHNTELVLQARVADFRPEMLRQLLYEDRTLVDGFDKMMSIYPVEDWPYFRRMRERERARLDGPRISGILPQVRAALEERGPVSSLDFDHDQMVEWFWAPTRVARAALESMYLWGELVIHHRVHTRKVYDLSRRLLPARLLDAPEPNPSEERYKEWRVERRIRNIGMTWDRSADSWLGISGMTGGERTAAIQRLVARRRLRPVTVDGMDWPLYVRTADLPALQEAASSRPPRPRAALIAPLDNLLWDRRLVHELFGFEYRWEVYKPAKERRHGYYVLPVLYGDRFIARMEPRREDGELLIKNWWWEPDVIPTDRMKADLVSCLKAFSRYLGADGARVDKAAAKREGLGWLARALS